MELVNKLIELLGREATLFEAFLGLLDRQTEMLVSNDIKGLNEVTERMRERLVESQLINRQRIELVERIRVANAIDGDLNVSRLLDIVDDQQADQLQRLRSLILDLNDRIGVSRSRNELLLNRSRMYIARMMEMLAKVGKPEENYTANGPRQAADLHLALDRRA
ncbi:MAG: flagellar protein FlgN [Candidatus Zixiibacteriota bacterium]|mgnify:CR=1 FL=1